MWADSKRRYRRYALGLDRLESCKGLKQYLNRCEQSNRKQLTANKENAPARNVGEGAVLIAARSL